MGDMTWGVAWSATQAEGAAPASDWRDWERQNRAPHSSDGSGFAVDFRSDLALFALAGFTAIRLELDWSRLEPELDHHDEKAIDFYREVLSAAREVGLAVWITLVDTSLPGWFALDERGFRERRTRSYYWPRHVEFCATTFGEWAAAWVPMARPLRMARSAYLTGFGPPGKRIPERFALALQGTHQAQCEAWRILRGAADVIACFDLAEVQAADREPTTRGEARRVHELLWCWAGMFRDGELHVPGLGVVLVPRNAADMLGIVLEPRIVVAESGLWRRELHPEDIGVVLRHALEEGPELPLAVIAQSVMDPDQSETVIELLDDARSDGLDARAWFHEPAIDGYERPGGFEQQAGLWNRSREPKPLLAPLAARALADRPPLDLDLRGAVELGSTGEFADSEDPEDPDRRRERS